MRISSAIGVLYTLQFTGKRNRDHGTGLTVAIAKSQSSPMLLNNTGNNGKTKAGSFCTHLVKNQLRTLVIVGTTLERVERTSD